MKKLTDMNAGELAAALVAMAEPIDHLISDQQLAEEMQHCAGPESAPFMRNTKVGVFLNVYAKLFPILLDKHLNDIIKIASICEGVSEKELLEKPGAEVMNSLIDAWRSQLGPFFGFAKQSA